MANTLLPAPSTTPSGVSVSSGKTAKTVRLLLWGLILGGLGAWGVELGRMIVFHNTHTVLDGQVYRTSQMNPKTLAAFVDKHNIRTVLNLRGHPPADWYPLQARQTQELGISQEDIAFSANRLPAPNELRRLIEVLDQCEYPIMIHCKQGADRTGLASAVVLLLHSDADYATARRQCTPRFGHVGMMNTTRAMDQFFTMYEDWLTTQSATHTPTLFRQWATTIYTPGHYVATLQLLDHRDTLPLGKATTVQVRATNISREPWQMRPGTATGVHVHYSLRRQNEILYEGRAGFRQATVNPGESVDFALPLPALKTPGPLVLYVDLSEGNFDFIQFGSEPLIYDWDCRTTPSTTHP